MLVLAVRTAVNAKQQRILRPGDIADRLHEQAVRLVAVLRLEATRPPSSPAAPRRATHRSGARAGAARRSRARRSRLAASRLRSAPPSWPSAVIDKSRRRRDARRSSVCDGAAARRRSSPRYRARSSVISEDDRLAVRGEVRRGHRTIERRGENARRPPSPARWRAGLHCTR